MLLQSLDWPGNDTRLELMCQFLVNNDFLYWYQLHFARDPKEWAGAHNFAERELDVVRARVKAMNEMIEEAKEAELEQRFKLELEYQRRKFEEL